MKHFETTFHDLVKQLSTVSTSASIIGPENTHQPANMSSQAIVHKLMKSLMAPTSCIVNFEALVQLSQLSSEGKSCLIFPEHYSNFDLPNLFYLLEQHGIEGQAVSDRIISIAGYKLNEESDFVRSFSEAYSRLVTCPTRTMEKLLENPEANVAEIGRAKAINMAALYRMTRLKHNGSIFLVYPTGTRYRPGVENTRQCLREMDSYLKSFDYVVLLGMAGNTLRINQESREMGNDQPTKDRIVFVSSEVISCKDFRSKLIENQIVEDKRQVVAEALTKSLAVLHARALEEYEREI